MARPDGAHGGVERPADGPRMVRRLNIDGDGQGDLAGHGGEHRAVFVYQIESYRYWQDQLGRDDFSYGQFGENFTIRGLADDQVCIGDRYRIGTALFEVTQPRVTCYRVGIRMDDPRIPALLVSHHRPGFYFRVLREGEVQAGDEIVQVAAGPEAMTVAEVDALLYLPGHSREQVTRALRIPALPAGWRNSFQAMLGQPEAPGGAAGNAGLTAVSPPPAWPGFRPLAVTATERESESVVSVYLADPGGAAVPPALPGQFLTLRLSAGDSGRPLLRSYSLFRHAGRGHLPDQRRTGAARRREPVCAQPRARGRHAGGCRATRHLRPAAGRIAGPADQRGRRRNPGAGHAACPGRRPGRPATSGGCTAPATGRRSRSPRSRARCWRGLPSGHRHICYSRPGQDDVHGRDYQTEGRLSASVLAALDLPRGAEAYLCGPAAFMADMSACWPRSALGVLLVAGGREVIAAAG